jgi:hypothetical protein
MLYHILYEFSHQLLAGRQTSSKLNEDIEPGLSITASDYSLSSWSTLTVLSCLCIQFLSAEISAFSDFPK